ncbi:MAG: hypothetical protein ACKPKO_33245 [Candidatus Fonsibacter sp.]
MSNWEMDRQQQRALISCASLAVAVAAVAVGVAEGAGSALLVVVVVYGGRRRLRGDLDHLKELVGELLDVLEPLGRPFGPSVFAVSLYLTRGEVA